MMPMPPAKMPPSTAPSGPQPAAAPGGTPSPGRFPVPPKEQIDADAEEVMAMIPPPVEPFKESVVKAVVTDFNATMDALAGEDVPDAPMPEAVDGKIDALPKQIVVPIVMLSRLFVKALGMPGYKIEPDWFKDDAGLRVVSGWLKKAAHDKKLIAAFKEGLEKEESAAETPSQESSEKVDDRLKGAMTAPAQRSGGAAPTMAM